jgi:mannose-6-phosphate isomerase
MIYQFNPILKATPWGGHKICQMKGLPASPTAIGESWELSTLNGMESVVAKGPYKGLTLTELAAQEGESLLGSRVCSAYGKTFPLLLKFIDAKEWLSLQVHPDDDTALALEGQGFNGKNELWHIVAAQPGAKIIAGFKDGISLQDYIDSEGSARMMEMVQFHDATVGRNFLIPAGTIHAIGSGVMIAEVQQSSDLTYRVYDHGRPRELHFDKARKSLKVMHYSGADCNHSRDFFVSRHETNSPDLIEPISGSFQAIMVLEGNCEIDGHNVCPGSTLLISANHGPAKITPHGKVVYLSVAM